MKQISLEDAITHLRELLYMNKTELLRAAHFAGPPGDKIRKSEVFLFAFERKFNSNVKDPTVVLVPGEIYKTPFNAKFGTGTEPS